MRTQICQGLCKHDRCPSTHRLRLACAVLCLGALCAGAATNDLAATLQTGLFEEEANHNLSAAIEAYQAVAVQFERDRKLAATAIFRLGECYRKRGNTNEAVTQYQRVLNEFADQAPLVALSRENLASLGNAPAPAAVAARAEQKRLVEEQITLLDKKLAAQQKQFEAGVVSQDTVWTTQGEILRLKQQIAALETGAGSPAGAGSAVASTSVEEEEVRRIQAMIKDSPDLINARSSENGMAPLHQAASKGQLVVAQYLLANGVDVDARCHVLSDRTALMLAASAGHKGMVELLLRHRANVRAADSGGFTALHLAAEKGFKSVVEVLLASGAEINARNGQKATALTVASAGGLKAICELLLARGADPNLDGYVRTDVRNFYGAPLHQAAQRADLPLAELLLAKQADPNLVDSRGLTPLFYAAQTAGASNVAAALLAHGAKVDPQIPSGDQAGWTPLAAAIQARQDHTAALLLKYRADPNARFKFVTSPGPGSSRETPGYTPLLLGISTANTNAVQLLLEAKADPNLSPDEANIPILKACDNRGYLRGILALLLDHGANVDARTASGVTPLMCAAMAVNPGNVRLLLDHKADVNAQDDDGRTALFVLAAETHTFGEPQVEVAELLLAAGANVNLTPSSGITPLACVAGDRGETAKLAALLRQHGALAQVPNFTLLRIARRGIDQATMVFRKDTNAVNRFTLLEVIGCFYAHPHGYYDRFSRRSQGSAMGLPQPPHYPVFGPGSLPDTALPYPDLSRLRIHRPVKTKPEEETILSVNLLSAAGVIDCAKDLPLEFGDVIEIPERDHPLSERPVGLTGDQTKELAGCLARKVTLVAKGQRVEITLDGQDNTYLSRAFQLEQVQAVLRSTSDLTRVRVTRAEPAAGEPKTTICNVQEFWNQRDLWDDLWLRNGDTVEVPDQE